MRKTYDRDDLAPLVRARFAEARSASGTSLQALAQRTGLSEQELHAFETGSLFLPAGRILSLAMALERPLTDFFPPDLHASNGEDLEDELKGLIISGLLNITNITRLIQILDMVSAEHGSIDGCDT